MEIDSFSQAPVVFEDERFVVEDRMADVNMHALTLWLAVGMAVATAVLLIFCTVPSQPSQHLGGIGVQSRTEQSTAASGCPGVDKSETRPWTSGFKTNDKNH